MSRKIEKMSNHISPLELLKQEVAKFESAIRHSDEAFRKGLVDTILNAQHRVNNNKLIIEYKKAILKLKKDGK